VPESKVSTAAARRLRFTRPLATVAICAGLLAGCNDSPDAMLASAKEYLAKDDISAAGIQLKNALQKDGSIAEARYLLGTVNQRQGDIQGAIKEFRRAAELGYPEKEVAPALARVLVQAGEFDQVLKDFAGRKLDDPVAQGRLLAAVGDAHLSKSEIDKARLAYEAALAANPEDVWARIGLGRAKLVRGDLDGAMREADAAVAKQPDVADGHALRGDVLIARDQADDAAAALENAVREKPGAVNYHFALVSLLLRENKLDAAEQRLAEMKKAAPKHPLTLYLQAFIDFRKNRLPEARDGLEAALAVAPDFLPAQVLAGAVYVRLKDHVRAQQHLGLVLARVPAQPLTRRLLAFSQLASGEPARALQTLEPMLDEGVSDKATLTLAGQIHLANGDFARASEYLEKASAGDPDDAVARTRLGVSRLIGGDATRAFSDLEAASELEGNTGQAETALILAHLRRGEFDQALAAQQQLEQKQPDNPQTYNLKGGVLMAKKDVAGARAAFEKALELKPDLLAAAINLVRIDLSEKRPEDARKRLERFISNNPRSVDGHLVLADLLARSGAKAEDVQAVLERAVSASPAAVAPKVALARHHLTTKDNKKALTLAQEIASANPNDPLAIGTLARVQAAVGDHQQAISSFNKLVSLQPKATRPLVELSDVQRLVKDRAGAEQSLRRALSLKADQIDAQQRLISLMVEDRRIEDAVEVARTVQKQRPDEVTGFVFEGDIHLTAGKPGDAVPALRKALDKSPEAGNIAVKLHSAQMGAGKRAEADKLAASWLRAQPRDLVMRGYLAERALAEKRLDDAEKLYREMIEVRPDNPLVLNNLAWVAGQRKDPEAIAIAERALALAPDSPAILDTIGMLQIERGAREEGLANLQKAVSLAPGVGALRLNLARAYLKVERKDDARQEIDAVLKQAREGTPLHAEATSLRQGL